MAIASTTEPSRTTEKGFVRSRKRPVPVSQTSLTMGLVAAAGALSLGDAEAQTARRAQPQPAPAASVTELNTIEVQGETENGLQATTGLTRLPGRVQEIPQTVTVINKETLEQQGVTTLDQALRNVPGVTVNIGEGGGGQNGDQFRIRGFQAKGDIYVDGLRDFGVYVRDSFFMESVQVFKGPTSESFGMGTTGGAINTNQKTAHLGDSYEFNATAGNGPVYRGTFDINKQINDTTAIRIVGMGHDQKLVGRDHLYTDRWGGLLSLGFGLGTDTTLTLNYFHQSGKRIPDFGVPIVTPFAGQYGRPVTEFGVPRSNFYGKESDIDDSNVDMFTARFKKEVTPWLTITNDSRLAAYNRLMQQTVPNCTTAACLTSVANGTFTGLHGLGGPAGYRQDSWAAQNILTALIKFNTGAFRHEMTTGVDFSYVHDKRTQMANVGAKVPGTIGSPIFANQPGFYVTESLQKKDSTSTNVAGFISDRMWLTDQLSILAGVRYDVYTSTYASSNAAGVWATPLSATTSFASPKASVIWEPTRDINLYASWARSYSNLAGQFVTADNTPISNTTLEPEESDLWEVGGKASLFGGRLGLTAALFHVKKNNSQQVDPVTGNIVVTNETQRVQGIELGVTGKVTDAWNVQFAYSYMDSRILGATVANAATIGNRVAFVPEHAASIWTTYEISQHLAMPGKLLVGLGLNYTGQMFVNSTNLSIIPASTTLDGLISYEYQNYRLSVNAYNLTDELWYSSQFGNRAVVAPGRTVMVTAGVKF